MKLLDIISLLKQQEFDATVGLPEPLFLYVSSVVPMVNIDILIKDNHKMLLSWRDDKYCGRGWHIPGGILRSKETLEERVKEVIRTEIFMNATFDNRPVKVSELVIPHAKERSHFISFLYTGFLDSSLPLNNGTRLETDPGFLRWFDSCPQDLLPIHNMYKEYLQ